MKDKGPNITFFFFFRCLFNFQILMNDCNFFFQEKRCVCAAYVADENFSLL